METLTEQQQLQESQYAFPYHYLPRVDDRTFSQIAVHRHGYEYLSYITFLLEYLGNIEFNSLLDVGCGDGRFICEAMNYFPHKEFLGIDYSERAILMAKAMCVQASYMVGDITNAKLFDRQFDVIVSIETLEHIPFELTGDFVQGLASHLKDDGYVLLTIPSDNIPVNPKHYQHFSEQSLHKTLTPFFEIQELAYLNRKSAVVRLVNRLLNNRFFIFREPKLMGLAYRTYLRFFFHAGSKNGTRLFAVCRKAGVARRA